MLLGIGSDLTDIRRIARVLERFGSRFEQRVFTGSERAKAAHRQGAGADVIAGTYAKRFAAKEACAKALGTGLHQGVGWQDIEVVNAPSGQPHLQLHGHAKEHLTSLCPKGMRPVLHLSLSDEYPYAQAFVVIEAVAK